MVSWSNNSSGNMVYQRSSMDLMGNCGWSLHNRLDNWGMGHSNSWGSCLDKWGRVEEVVDEGSVDCKGCGNWGSLNWSSKSWSSMESSNSRGSLNNWGSDCWSSFNYWGSNSWSSLDDWSSMESWGSYGVSSSNNWGSNSDWSSSNNWGSWGNWVNKTILIKVLGESLKSK